MKLLFKGGRVFRDGKLIEADVLVEDGILTRIEPGIAPIDDSDGRTVECGRFVISAGFADPHVHLREPGYTQKATIASETRAAAAGGFTHVGAMPNLDPVPDSMAHLQQELDVIATDAVINVVPIGAITVGEKGEELADLDALAPHVFGFSDDGFGVQSGNLMREGFGAAARLGIPILAHCEVEEIVGDGVIHDGELAKKLGLPGKPSEGEWKMVERDIQLARETGAHYHVCHLSTKETVELLREAKAEGLRVTGEAAPHYLCFNDGIIEDHGRFRMNPPIRSKEDQEAVQEAFADGTIDFLATDHAPHTQEEKSHGLAGSANGIIGMETSFPGVNHEMVISGKMTLEALLDRMVTTPRKFMGIEPEMQIGKPADLVVFDPNESYVVDSSEFQSASRSTPFEGKTVTGRVHLTMYNGEIVWER